MSLLASLSVLIHLRARTQRRRSTSSCAIGRPNKSDHGVLLDSTRWIIEIVDIQERWHQACGVPICSLSGDKDVVIDRGSV
jgi:hypothetical protein